MMNVAASLDHADIDYGDQFRAFPGTWSPKPKSAFKPDRDSDKGVTL
jgi:hypothetical protein